MAKSAKKIPSKQKPAHSIDTFEASFQQLLHNPDLMFQAFDLFPFPIEVFAADGTTVFVNRTGNEMFGVPDASFIVGKYNVLKDPVMEQMGMKETLQKAFRGELAVSHDVNLPIQNLVDRGVISEKPFEKSSTDWHFYPIKDGRKVAFVVFICIVKKLYHGRSDLARAKEYLDSHWQDEYDRNAVAKAAGMSVTQLYTCFKQHTGMTPGEYHKKIKVDMVKEKLKLKHLSVKDVYTQCSVNNRSSFSRLFKRMTGFSPIQFRKEL